MKTAPITHKILSVCIALFSLSTMLMADRFAAVNTGQSPSEVHGAFPEAGAGEEPLRAVPFRYHPGRGGVQKVFLAGTFNDWSDLKNPMTDDNSDGVFEAILFLLEGSYQYKFIADGQWVTNPAAKTFMDDGRGGKNAIVLVDDHYPVAKFEKGDGLIMVADVPFRLDYSMVNPLSSKKIEFRAKAHRNDVEQVQLVYRVEGHDERTVAMAIGEMDGVFQYFHGTLDIPTPSKTRFFFRYRDGGKDLYATPRGFRDSQPGEVDMFLFSPDSLKPFTTPEWAKNGVFYQIFPDRFRNGDHANDQDFHEKYYERKNTLPPGGKTNGEYFHWVKDWKDVSGLSKSPYRTDGKPDYYSFYGGDIAGVLKKLPYLRDLGVTIIYFNPLSEAKSNHKYDAVDYLKIDPHFADEKTFQEFVKKAHEVGIRIIVDMAFNHTGDWHFAFVDSKERGKESKYWNWYEWKRWPLPQEGPPTPCDYYDCWWGFPIHPNLNYDLSRPNDQENAIEDIAQAEPNKEVVQYILEVPRYWLGVLGIDGFRLDVPNEVPFWFWKEFRKAVDTVNPDAFLIGEIWGNAMPWLGPNCFHSTMNYKFFRDPVLKFFALGESSATQFDKELAPGRTVYPIQATQVMMNLIDSHDTERFITVAGNDDRRLMLAALFQMTYLGIPQIYYGDEVGLQGGKDPDNRRTFPWDWGKNESRKHIHDYYQKIIAIRHQFEALRTGIFQTLFTDGKVYAFLREDKNDRIVIVLNNETHAKEIRIPLREFGFVDGTDFKDVLGKKTFSVNHDEVKLCLDPLSGAVLVMDRKK